MATKPSLRSKSFSKSVDLNLVPYLDIVINIIMFMLFTSTGLIQIGVINVNAPQYQDPLAGGADQENRGPDEKQLNLTVGITYQGFFIAGVGGVLGAVGAETKEAETSGPTIPLLTSDKICQDALARQLPPPVNCYDYGRLTLEMIKIKNQFSNESKIVLYAQPDVPFEVLIKVMDSTREYEGRSLFFDVILSPEIA